MYVMLNFFDIREHFPPHDNDEYYGQRYSIPVLVANAITGQIFNEIVRYDFRMNGWVYSDLSDGPDPEDYEICHVTHWAKFPTNCK